MEGVEPSKERLQASNALKEREAIMTATETLTFTTQGKNNHSSSSSHRGISDAGCNEKSKDFYMKDCQGEDIAVGVEGYICAGDNNGKDKSRKDEDMNIDTNSARCSINDNNSSNRKVITMFIVFGGFCTKERALKGDIQVILCTADKPSPAPTPDNQFPRFVYNTIRSSTHICTVYEYFHVHKDQYRHTNTYVYEYNHF
jgi:hypothetical protein